METQQRRLRDPGMPGRRLWEHANIDTLSLRRGSGSARSQGRGSRDQRPRRLRTTALARPATQRPAAEFPATMKRTLSIVALVILVVGRPTAQAEPGKPAPSMDFDSF